jgi:putative addiction module component (TIGR02574 family)
MSVTAIQSELLNLPVVERARLLDVIWESLSEPETKAREAAWATESERRIDAYDNGKLTARPASEVFSDLKKSLRK